MARNRGTRETNTNPAGGPPADGKTPIQRAAETLLRNDVVVQLRNDMMDECVETALRSSDPFTREMQRLSFLALENLFERISAVADGTYKSADAPQTFTAEPTEPTH